VTKSLFYAIIYLMEIGIIIDEEYEPSFDPDWLEKVVRRVLMLEKAPENAEMGLVITSGEEVGTLSREYLKDEATHDVLTFAFNPGSPKDKDFILPPDGLLHLGEVIISYPQAAIQAGEQKHSVRTEVVVLTIHGILHLLGYDHAEPDDEKKMRARESEIFNTINSEFA
jgi:probable rRNA maturation factor